MSDELTVYYDGACPLCRREIAFYRRKRGADSVRWEDVSRDDCDIPPGLTRTAALARFHVRDRDGTLFDGGGAFARLWAALPGFRLLGRLCRLAPITWLLDRAYDAFLPLRPRLQRLAGHRSACPPRQR